MSAEFAPFVAPHSQPGRSRNPIWGALVGFAVALPATVWFWGFTVDDALITARVAVHVGQGLGPRFNAHGPLADAVTPLGYAQLLALFRQTSPEGVFGFAKWLGAVAWLAAAGVLGLLISRAGQRWQRFSPLGLVAISAPLAAWSVSGMETGLVTFLATLGLIGGASGALAVGAAAAWRPELVPFALTLVVGSVLVERGSRRRSALLIGLAVAPALLVALLRLVTFGRAVPLAFYAKPSDFGHGFRYACGAFAFCGLPWLALCTPRQWLRLPPRARPLFVALAAHGAALVLCGGDWMALYRLAVPVLPGTALAAAYVAEQARAVFAIPRGVLAMAGALLLAFGLGRDARGVGGDRARLIAEARPVLASDPRIAALDVGWVGAASDAEVIDLAGVTDPAVAFLRGGHTSKQVPAAWLFARRPTAIVLLLARGKPLDSPFEMSWFSRAVEQRVAALVAQDYRPRTTLNVGGQTYLVLEPAR